jgi:hypothetical protein
MTPGVLGKSITFTVTKLSGEVTKRAPKLEYCTNKSAANSRKFNQLVTYLSSNNRVGFIDEYEAENRVHLVDGRIGIQRIGNEFEHVLIVIDVVLYKNLISVPN